MSTFGDRLRRVRKETGLTQKEVAEQLHLHRSTYTKYERDQSVPSLAVLYRLTVILNVDPIILIKPD